MYARKLIFTLALFLCIGMRANDAAYLHYTIDQGLPSNEVYDVYEDSLGYIWFATDHGISRYDGYSFKNFSTSDGLVHNTIFGFYEDHRGLIWMRSFNSQLCYMQNGIIKPYVHNAKLQAFLGRDFVQRYAFDLAGNLWFIPVRNNLGLFFQDHITGAIKQVDLPDGYNAFIRMFDSGEVLGGVDNNNGFDGLSEPDDEVLAENQTWYFRVQKTSSFFRRELIGCRAMGHNSFAFSYDNYFLTIENAVITHRRRFEQNVNRMYVDSNYLWLSMDGFRRSVAGVKDEEPYLRGQIAQGMLRDRMGNYWFTTLTDGVYLAREMQMSVLNTVADLKVDVVIKLEQYSPFLIAMDSKSHFFHIPVGTRGPEVAAIQTWTSDFEAINTFYVDAPGNQMHIKYLVYNISPYGVAPGTQNNPAHKKYPTAIRDFWRHGDSLLIAGNTEWSISRIRDTSTYKSSQHGFRGFCTAIAADSAHNVWIGTSDGLHIFSGENTLPYEPDDSLYRQRVTDIGITKYGQVVVATRGGGLLIIDKDTTYELRMRHGLASDECGNILVDDTVVWICSNSGLTKMVMSRSGDHFTFTFQRFNQQHGLPSDQINDVLRMGNNLYIATGHGLAWFDINYFCFNIQPPAVYISTFHVNNRELGLDSCKLNWNDRNITIGYLALLFRSPGLVNYRYKLEGYEDEWHYTTERAAHYYNLPAGTYRFVVSAMNENGMWNESAAVQQFQIPQHYTETLWFRTLIIALILLALVIMAFLYLRQQQTKAKAALELALAEQKALRAQMKPHFIFNSLNSIQNFIINRDEDAAQLYLTNFAQLMRRVLDHSRTSTVTLEEEIETMRLYLEIEKLRFGQNFRFTINVQKGINPSALLLPALFIQPFVENAIWHGLQLQKNSPSLEVSFTLEGNKLKCIVEDNGIGRKRAAENRKKGHVSTGLKNVEERIAVLNATSRDKISVSFTDLSDAGGNPAGTRVEILFPVMRNDED
jgi:hypothetical protein